LETAVIIRIFRIHVPTAQHPEFEQGLQPILDAVKSYPGVVSVSIGLPTRGAPEDYEVISTGASAKYLEAFAGPNWEQPLLPAGMEKFATACWVHHYKVYSPPAPKQASQESSDPGLSS
jgi:hypothetical protein